MCCALAVSCRMNSINNVYSTYKSQILYFLLRKQVTSFLCDQRSNFILFLLLFPPKFNGATAAFFSATWLVCLCSVFLSRVGHAVVPLISMQC